MSTQEEIYKKARHYNECIKAKVCPDCGSKLVSKKTELDRVGFILEYVTYEITLVCQGCKKSYE